MSIYIQRYDLLGNQLQAAPDPIQLLKKFLPNANVDQIRNSLYDQIVAGLSAQAKLLCEHAKTHNINLTTPVKGIDLLTLAKEKGRVEIIKLLQTNNPSLADKPVIFHKR